MKNKLFSFALIALMLTGCTVIRNKPPNRGLLVSLRKINDNLNQKIVNLENEIKILKSSNDVDVPKAELLKKLQAIEKDRDDAISNVRDRKHNIRQQKTSERLELELIDAKNEVVVLNKNNTDLEALVAKLSKKINVITKGDSSPPGTGKEKSQAKTLKTKKTSQKAKSSKSTQAKVKDKKADEKKQNFLKKKSAKVAKKSPLAKSKPKPKKVEKTPKKKASSPSPKSKAAAPSKKQPPKLIVVAAKPNKVKPEKSAIKQSKASTLPKAKTKVAAKAKKPSTVATKSAVTQANPSAAKTTKIKVAKITPETSKMKSAKSALSDKKAVLELLTQWKKTWEKRDAKTYIGFYSPRFKGRGMDLKSWNNYKTNNFRSKKNILIKITDINTVKRNNGDIVVKFVQHYKADKYSDIGLKSLRWTKTSDGWKIVMESWRPSKKISF